MTFFELNCYAKVYNAAMGFIDRNSVTRQEIEVTMEILKKVADEHDDWSDEEKEIYKALAGYVKKRVETNCWKQKEQN